MGAEQVQLLYGPTGTSSSNCQETETCTVRTHHTPEQPLQTSPSWLAEEMLDGQHQRVDISAHARTPYNGLLQKRLEEDLC